MDNKEEVKKIAIIVSKNSLEDVYAGLVMANGAVMEGIETIMFFTFFGLDAITKKSMNNLKVGNPEAFIAKMPPMDGHMPENLGDFVTEQIKNQFEEMDFAPVDEFIEMINAGGGKIYACRLAADMFQLTEEDFCDELDGIISVGEMYEMAGGAQMVYI